MDLDEFKDVRSRLDFLDDIETAMSFPKEFTEVRYKHIRPLSDYYRRIHATSADWNPQSGIVGLVNRLARYRDIDAILVGHLNNLEEVLGREESESNRQGADMLADGFIGSCAVMKSALANYICLLNWGLPITEIYEYAVAGDLPKFLWLLQVDKSAILAPEVTDFVLHLQYSADWGLLERVGKAVAARPLNTNADVPKAVALVAYFWESDFSKMTFPQTVDFLVGEDILPKRHNYDYFHKQLLKFDLKKTRYNRKK